MQMVVGVPKAAARERLLRPGNPLVGAGANPGRHARFPSIVHTDTIATAFRTHRCLITCADIPPTPLVECSGLQRWAGHPPTLSWSGCTGFA
jgi:hypothetical protein